MSRPTKQLHLWITSSDLEDYTFDNEKETWRRSASGPDTFHHYIEYSAHAELIAKLEIVTRYHYGDGTITRDMFMDAIGTTRTTTKVEE